MAVGDIIRYSCDTGYALSGEEERVCEVDSQWSGDPPACLVGTFTAARDSLTVTLHFNKSLTCSRRFIAICNIFGTFQCLILCATICLLPFVFVQFVLIVLQETLTSIIIPVVVHGVL